MDYVIGIDEVGRGPLAGPVVVSAVAIPQHFRCSKKIGTLKDSKQLTHTQRDLWFQYFKLHPQVVFTTARVYPTRIDQLDISRAANRAAFLAYQKLIERHKSVRLSHKVFLDGSLYLQTKEVSQKTYRAKTIVKGDETYPAIMIASIMAKVTRDKYMTRLAKQYPDYGFEVHKGYGTRAHRKALRRFGLTPVHRETFVHVK